MDPGREDESDDTAEAAEPVLTLQFEQVNKGSALWQRGGSCASGTAGTQLIAIALFPGWLVGLRTGRDLARSPRG